MSNGLVHIGEINGGDCCSGCFLEGVEQERQRIIALLEAEMDNVSELPGALGETLSDHIFELIALIKGENK